MEALIKMTLFVFLSNAIALKMFKSNDNDNGENVISGLHYKRKQDGKMPVLSNSLTVCVRFNIKRYGIHGKNIAQILEIRNKRFLILGIRAGYPRSWLTLGNSNHEDEFNFWRMLYDPKRKSYPLWKLFIWHHICFSYSKQSSYISFVQVRRNKNECEIHSKVIVSQDYFDYGLRLDHTVVKWDTITHLRLLYN